MSNELTQADIERLKATLAKADIDLPLSYQKAKPGVDPDCAIYDCDNRFLAESFHHVGKTRFTDSEKFADLTTDVLNTLPALLEAAEYGKKAQGFFREMENKLADQRVTVICNDYCPIDLAKAAGLLPKEGE